MPRRQGGRSFRVKSYHLCDRRLCRPTPLVADGMLCDIGRHPVSNNRSKLKHPFKKDASREQGMTVNFHHPSVF
jgi:hypothetical protein